MALQNLGSLITYTDDGGEHCLGYLWHAEGHGTYDPSLGRVEVSKQDADTHNRLLDEALLKGLDERCEIGQGGTFYLGQECGGRPIVKTWLGTPVSNVITKRGNSITFTRAGKRFRGRLQKDADCFNFRRIA